MQQRLIILSDLWGVDRSQWWSFYEQPLRQHFELQWYDCCLLGQINLAHYEQEELHQQFLDGGIERAVDRLLAAEKHYPPAYVLAFSIGGTISWRAILQGLSCSYFCAVSATRLRKEDEQLSIRGKLYYGEDDPYRPDEKWSERQVHLSHALLPNHGHEVYTKAEIAKIIVRELIALGNDK
ncbi:alpha/beta hydrolase [Lewinella sp. LCG006]|uniref:alpha/beta hydrolase n=1 Tax=Lewinella sp. LCG006 TaxID=3231911 RepID=UPI0034604461